MDDIQPITEQEPAIYETGTAVAEGDSAVIEIYRCKGKGDDYTRLVVAAVMMMDGMVMAPQVEDVAYEGPVEQERYMDKMMEALGEMADYYASLPEEMKKKHDEKQAAKEANRENS